MNPLINEAQNIVQGGWLLGLMTAVFFATFLYWFWYAYAPSHKERLEDLGNMPFDLEPPVNDGGDR